MVNDVDAANSQHAESGEWTRLVSPAREFSSVEGGCLAFDYQSRFVDLDVYLLMTTSPGITHVVDIHHDGQVPPPAYYLSSI